jgi:hypothetical protein
VFCGDCNGERGYHEVDCQWNGMGVIAPGVCGSCSHAIGNDHDELCHMQGRVEMEAS